MAILANTGHDIQYRTNIAPILFPTPDVFTQSRAPSGTANIKRQKDNGFQFSRNCVEDVVNESIAPE